MQDTTYWSLFLAWHGACGIIVTKQDLGPQTWAHQTDQPRDYSQSKVNHWRIPVGLSHSASLQKTRWRSVGTSITSMVQSQLRCRRIFTPQDCRDRRHNKGSRRVSNNNPQQAPASATGSLRSWGEGHGWGGPLRVGCWHQGRHLWDGLKRGFRRSFRLYYPSRLHSGYHCWHPSSAAGFQTYSAPTCEAASKQTGTLFGSAC